MDKLDELLLKVKSQGILSVAGERRAYICLGGPDWVSLKVSDVVTLSKRLGCEIAIFYPERDSLLVFNDRGVGSYNLVSKQKPDIYERLNDALKELYIKP